MIGDYIRELKEAIGEVLEREVEVLAKGCVSDYEEYRDWETDRKSTRLNSSHSAKSRMPSSA